MKGKGEVLWSGVNAIFTGVHEMERTREGVAVLLNDVRHSAVVKSGCVSSRILWIIFKFVVGYGPNEGDGEERELWVASGLDIDCAFWEI